jgi:hypothetical protein
MLLLAGCGVFGPSVGESKTQFCDDWKALQASLANAKALNENSTVEQAQDAQKQVEQAWNKAKNSAAQLQDVQIQAAEDAYNAFTQAVNSIPQEATLGQASAAVQVAANALDTAVTAINTTVCVAG